MKIDVAPLHYWSIFFDFSFIRLSFADIVLGRPDTRNIDDILLIYHNISVHGNDLGKKLT